MDQLILALDVNEAETALAWVRRFKNRTTSFKIGSQLFSRHGPALVKAIQAEGANIFLDLKWHDIPQTVAHAVSAAVNLGVQMATIHTSGGREMIRAAVASAKGSDLRLLGVTVLTSLDEQAVQDVGVAKNPEVNAEKTLLEGQVIRLARLALESGLDSLVCSPQEIALLRAEFKPNLCLVTPGVRPAGSDAGDQKRTMTPGQAARLGANYLVVGRPIFQAPDPDAMLDAVLAELK